MGNFIWTLITYIATFGIVLTAFRLYVRDRQDTAEEALRAPPIIRR
jgi:hypothetical protein